ncbi:Hypoxanthine-guanine phosphoribosyltransferase [Pseudoclavibacter triregionum]|nr:Hypoxanthine-guanine phosphoribosyltransferase [Pseudoclavibacter triregionum]
MRADDCRDDVREVLYTEEQIRSRLAELAREIERDYEGREPLLIGVLKGAVMVVSDLSRELRIPVTMDWMAVSSYGSGTTSSGVVRIVKDLDTDLTDKDVLIVEDIIDSGLTLSWLKSNLESRGPNSVEICTLLRKPSRLKSDVPVKYIGYDVPNEFVVGYGLDYDEAYRHLRDVVVLKPHVYGGEETVEPEREQLEEGAGPSEHPEV